MKRDVIKLPSRNLSFYSFEKDVETIVKKLFTENTYSEDLKRLLVINKKDCIDDRTSEVYRNIIKDTTVAKLVENGYITTTPKIRFPEHEEIKSYIVISFDDFTLNDTNPEFRDCTISFDIICHLDYWDIGNYRTRPIKIAGYIDGLLNGSKMSGIGTLNFLGMNELVMNETLSGYCLMYRATHGSDDFIPKKEELRPEDMVPVE